MPPAFADPPCSLSTMKTDGTAVDEKEEELSQVVGKNSPFRRLLWILGYHSNEAMSIRAATGMYNAVCQQVDHGPCTTSRRCRRPSTRVGAPGSFSPDALLAENPDLQG